MPKAKMDDEMKVFAADVLESIGQAKRGEAACTHTPVDIASYKARGRPAGSTKQDSKQAVTVRTALTFWKPSVPPELAGKPG